MLIVAGTITFDPAKTDQAKVAASKMMAATHEEEGNVEYNFAVDMADPSLIRLFEVWDSQAALDAHMGMPHMAEFGAAVGEIGVTGMDILKYEISSSGPLN